jgi:hypothetical protein
MTTLTQSDKYVSSSDGVSELSKPGDALEQEQLKNDQRLTRARQEDRALNVIIVYPKKR